LNQGLADKEIAMSHVNSCIQQHWHIRTYGRLSANTWRAFAASLVCISQLFGFSNGYAASTSQAESSTIQVFAAFAALSLNTKSDLSGTAIAVRKVRAWVSVINPAAAPPIHRIILQSWICVDAVQANCPTKDDPAIYYVSDADYNAGYSASVGVSYGILAVPFKYHFSDHALTAGSSLGGYIGLTQDAGFTQISEILGGGLALVSATAATSNFAGGTSGGSSTTSAGATASSTTSTLTGVSIATGLLGKVGSTNTQFGLLLGMDFVDKSANYKYNSKLWLSFSIGYNFGS
jgi:hypothetical protein